MIHFSQKRLNAIYIWEVRLRQQTQRGDEISSRERLAGGALHDPDVLLLVVSRVLELGVELHVPAQVMAGDDMVQVCEHLGLFDVVFLPVVLQQVVFVPAVAVDCMVSWGRVSQSCVHFRQCDGSMGRRERERE